MGREFENEDIEHEATGIGFNGIWADLEDTGTVNGVSGSEVIVFDGNPFEEERFLFVEEIGIIGDDADSFH